MPSLLASSRALICIHQTLKESNDLEDSLEVMLKGGRLPTMRKGQILSQMVLNILESPCSLPTIKQERKMLKKCFIHSK